ncbi:MAG: hypothetical protein R3A52_09025 [Polyangiales bacterium]
MYAGRYADARYAASVDAPSGVEPVDVAFAVGALAFTGRLTEAESLAADAARDGDPRTVSAAPFFVSVALASPRTSRRGPPLDR